MAVRMFRTAGPARGARKGAGAAKGTAVAAAALAALTASQAPAAVPAGASEAARPAASAEGPSVSGDTPYRTELPPPRTGRPDGDTGPGPDTGTAADAGPEHPGGALPATVFAAYRHAETEIARTAPGCRLRWQLLAAIGQVESGQAWGGRVTPDGRTVTPILGPRLDGGAFAAVPDTDGGAWDGDPVYDRAVGPMQFIPSTWARWGADGNGDGVADPNNVYDAALAAGRYLCAGGRDLSDPAGLDAAILGYNHSEAYLRTVSAWYAYFLEGHQVVPDLPADPPARPKAPTRPAPSPKATAKPSGHRPPSARPSREPSAPQPSPSSAPSHSGGGLSATAGPQLPLPAPSVTLPGGSGLPGPGSLTSKR